MTKGYWQIGIAEECRKFTAFQAGGGLYEFTRMAFGLKNAPATFNRMMAQLFSNREDVVHYFDDLTIFNEDWDSHICAVREVLSTFVQFNLTARPKKTEIGFPSIPLLGFHVGNGVMKPTSDNVYKILNIKVPKTKKQVRSVIGLINFYSKFLPNLAVLLKPLFKLTEKGAPEKVVWTDDCEYTLQNIQSIINNSQVLVLPDLSKQFFVQTDASGHGLGAALLQERNGQLRPCLFLSRKLQRREENYAVVEQECLAIVWALQKLARYLIGRPFILQSDHQPLRYLQTSRTLNARLCRWALILQQFEFRIEYVPGKANALADFLSRNI